MFVQIREYFVLFSFNRKGKDEDLGLLKKTKKSQKKIHQAEAADRPAGKNSRPETQRLVMTQGSYTRLGAVSLIAQFGPRPGKESSCCLSMFKRIFFKLSTPFIVSSVWGSVTTRCKRDQNFARQFMIQVKMLLGR